ncbi:MAG: hypothetical protein HYR56_32330 [Acidobacteria bacterium]|nr:hypothetical protein [Acidobacteriota bacterium]MBI3424902.1 hypothetical protein [Acidobacteriota bacterium]
MASEIAGPFISAAVLCHMVIEEKDGVNSIIRMVDRLIFTVSGEAPEEMPSIPVNNLVLFLGFKSGLARDSYLIKLTLSSPSGEETNQASFTALFEGEERGVNVKLQLNLEIKEEGLHWFNVYLHDDLVTKVPLRVIYHRVLQG